MNSSELVTIIIPTYNQADYLSQAIESVLNQDYIHLECIILNDGSSDNTNEIVDSYKERIRYVRHSNIGQSKTINKGFDMANGKYIGYLSSDDVLKSNAVSTLVKALARSPEITVVYPDFELIDSNNKYLGLVQTEEYSLKRLEIDLVCQPGPGALFSKEIYKKAGGWNPNLVHVPDYEFWLRMAHHGNFKRIPQPLAQYRISESSNSYRKISSQKSMEIVDVMIHYWSKDPRSPGAESKKSIARAYILAVKSHMQSSRLIEGLKCFLRSLVINPLTPFYTSTWQCLFSGLFRRMFYRYTLRKRSI